MRARIEEWILGALGVSSAGQGRRGLKADEHAFVVVCGGRVGSVRERRSTCHVHPHGIKTIKIATGLL